MKLLIDIPEHVYEHAKEESEDSRDEGEAMRAIANGSQQESCGDAISRQSAIFLASDLKQDLPDDERIADMVMAHNEGILEYQTQLSLMPSVTPQPCEDAISRQAAKRAIEALQRPIMREESNYYQFKFSGMSEALDVVENLPSVTPKPKMGRWEWVQYDYNPKLGNWHCSECRCVVMECVDKNEKSYIPLYKYCPQCGARMAEPQESEDE